MNFLGIFRHKFQMAKSAKNLSYTFHNPRDFYSLQVSWSHVITSWHFFFAAPPQCAIVEGIMGKQLEDTSKFVWNQVEPDVQDNENQRCDLKNSRNFLQRIEVVFVHQRHPKAVETLERARIHVPDATPRLFPKVVVHFGRNSPQQGSFHWVFACEEWRLLGHPTKAPGNEFTSNPVSATWTNMGLYWDYDAWSILIHPIIDAWNSKHGPKVLFF